MFIVLWVNDNKSSYTIWDIQYGCDKYLPVSPKGFLLVPGFRLRLNQHC